MIKKIFFITLLGVNLNNSANESMRNSISCSTGSLMINNGLDIVGNLHVYGTITASGIAANITGAVGATGATGSKGAPGPKGATGASASAISGFKLLIYYGYPSLLQVNGNAIQNTNGTPNLSGIAQAFAEYDVIVLGSGLESPTHSDHANTLAIISKIHSLKPSALIFGYIDLGVSTSNFTIAQMQAFTDQWKAMGVNGIFWDDAGYDYLNTRARQSTMILYARNKSLISFMNAYNPDDIFSSTAGTYNPTGMPSVMSANDWFLLESLPFNNETTSAPWATNSGWIDRTSLLNRITDAQSWRSTFGSKIAAVSVVNYAAGSASSTAANFNANNAYNQYLRNVIQAIGFVSSFDAYGDCAQGFSAFGTNANQIFKGWFDLEMARFGQGPQPFSNDGPAGTTLSRYDYYTVVYYSTGNWAAATPLTRASTSTP